MKLHANRQVHFQFGISVQRTFVSNKVLKQILSTLSRDRLDKQNPISSSLQHADDIPLPVAGLSLLVNHVTTPGLASK